MTSVDRERFLNDKEMETLKSMLCEMGVTSAENVLTKDVLSDEHLISVHKRFMYDWHDFCALKEPYINGKTKNTGPELSKKNGGLSTEVKCVER